MNEGAGKYACNSWLAGRVFAPKAAKQIPGCEQLLDMVLSLFVLPIGGNTINSAGLFEKKLQKIMGWKMDLFVCMG